MMYQDGSDAAPPRNGCAANCEICGESVRPGDGFVTESRLGWAGRVWTEVHCEPCFSHNYPKSAAKCMTAVELHAAQFAYDAWYAKTH